QRPEPGKPVPVSLLTPEPLDVWRREIRELKAVGDLWDRIAAGDRRGEEMLERKLAAALVRAPFHLSAVREDGSGFRMRYRPATLRTALWQRLAGEVAGQLQCAPCPAPAVAAGSSRARPPEEIASSAPIRAESEPSDVNHCKPPIVLRLHEWNFAHERPSVLFSLEVERV